LKTGAAALESGGSIKVYFAASGDDFKKFQKEGILTDDRTRLTLDPKEARKDASSLSSSRGKLYPVWAIGQIDVKDKDILGDKTGDHFDIGKNIPASDIKLSKTNMAKYFEKDFTEPENLRPDLEKNYPQLFELKYGGQAPWDYIFIARNKEEWDYFLFTLRMPEHYTKRRGRRKGPNTQRTFSGWKLEDVVELLLVTSTRVLMFKPGTTKDEILKFLARQWLNQTELLYSIGWQLRREKNLDDNIDLGYDIFFKKKYPDWLMYYMITLPFEKPEEEIERITKAIKSVLPPYHPSGKEK
jgi:hypothetical protein